MEDNIRDLIYRALNESISPDEFNRLQDAIENDADVRAQYLQAVRLAETLGSLSSAAKLPQEDAGANTQVEPPAKPAPENSRPVIGQRSSLSLIALAATILIIATGTAFWLGQLQRSAETDPARLQRSLDDELAASTIESRIAGHATLRNAVDIVWSSNSAGCREGDVLPNGVFSFSEGIAEIDFFCGATLLVEGPAELDIESDWSVRVTQGRLRATVPPAARGFIVKVAGSEIIDLGTEFAVDVSTDNVHVEVIDGEVKLRGGAHDGKHLLTGDSESLKGGQPQTKFANSLSTITDIRKRHQAAEELRFSNWTAQVSKLKSDKRLIAYYPIGCCLDGRIARDVSHDKDVSDGLLVGPVDRSTGRFGRPSTGLNFDRPGSRVRTRLEGEFQAFTFSCWVRIDSLEHRYNALFMADSYETGEPHWQIRDDGRLMFSVMVDDTKDVEFFNRREQRIVKDAGLHRVYYTDPIWDLSKSGQWFHLVAVYDPAARRVDQYVDGKRIASEKIDDQFHITSLTIGAAEIGNWGQPFRDSPWFAVRNLNGTIDELAIFNSALSAKEVNNLFLQGKPLGY